MFSMGFTSSPGDVSPEGFSTEGAISTDERLTGDQKMALLRVLDTYVDARRLRASGPLDGAGLRLPR